MVTTAVTGGTSKSSDNSITNTDGVINKVIVDDSNNKGTEKQQSGAKKSGTQKKVIEPADIREVGYAYTVSDKMSDESSKLIKEKVKYDNDGYAKIGDRYVISCDSSIGKVGDVFRFTKEDGTFTELVVGVNTESSKYKNRINFLIDKNSAGNLHANEVSKNLLRNNKTIENYGNIDEYGKKVTIINNTLPTTVSDGTNNSRASEVVNELVENNLPTTVSGGNNSNSTNKTVDTSSIMGKESIGSLSDTLLSNKLEVTENMKKIMDNVDINSIEF